MRIVSEEDSRLLESHLSRRLDAALAADGLAPMNAAIRAYVQAGGKRIRPQLCLWTWRQTSGQSAAQPPSSVLDMAGVWELFHAFLLTHDDIIDNGDTRRNQPSMHRRLAELDGGSTVFGANLAIVAGDLLFSAAIGILHNVEAPNDQFRALLRLFDRISTTTGFGQAIDILQEHVALDDVNEQTLLREYHWKTAAYTFEGPMLSGAILAGASESTLRCISEFALALGQAYQLHNDLIDLTAPAHEGSDVMQGKRTVTLVRARATLPPDQRRDFDTQLQAIQTPATSATEKLTRAEQLRRRILDTTAPAQTRRTIDGFLTTADSAATAPAITPALSTGLRAILDSLRLRYFQSA